MTPSTAHVGWRGGPAGPTGQHVGLKVQLACVAPTICDAPCRATGVPPEFNEYLPKDCEEYKKWKAATQSGAVEGQLDQLSLKDGGAAPAPEPEGKQLPGGKKKKKQKPEVGSSASGRATGLRRSQGWPGGWAGRPRCLGAILALASQLVLARVQFLWRQGTKGEGKGCWPCPADS
jgi:hypothetical protein